MSFTNDAEDLVLTWLFTDSTATRPTAWYASLHSADPGETGANEITTGWVTSYRKTVTFTDGSSGACSNEASVSWTANADHSAITHVSIWDAATSGNCLAIGELFAPHSVVNGGVVSFGIGDIEITLD